MCVNCNYVCKPTHHVLNSIPISSLSLIIDGRHDEMYKVSRDHFRNVRDIEILVLIASRSIISQISVPLRLSEITQI